MGVTKAADGDGGTAQPAAQVDADEFGLPTKRYPSPAMQEEAQKPTEQPGAKAQNAPSTETTSDDKVAKSDSDSDDGTFEDAPTEPVPGSSTASLSKKQEPAEAPQTPKLPSAGDDEDGAATPVVEKHSSKTEQGRAGPETPVATTSDPDAKVQDNIPADDGKPEDAKMAQKGHNRDISVASKASVTSGTGGVGISEFSHQQVSTQEEVHTENGDDGWQTMPAFAPYDMYDDDNRLIAREMEEIHEKDADQGLGGAGKGYTRVLMDEDAESATSMDENTQYLFKEMNGTSMTEDDDGRDAVSQMQATKDLLTEGQRVAYVGVVRLEISTMEKAADGMLVTRRTKKQVNTAAEAEKMWGQKMMLRLYAHMDISEAEQIMIEQLAQHGVVPTDLTPTLHANSRVVNPMAEERPSTDADAESIGTGSKNASPKMPGTPVTPKSPGTPKPPSPAEEDEKPAEMPPPYESLDHGEVPDAQMPSQLPTTQKIDIDLRWTVLCDLFLLLIADSVYDARSRVLLERVGESLDIPWIDICRFEKRVTDALEMQQAAEKENWNEDEHMVSRAKLAKKHRYMMMGLATVGGGLVIGLSAGLLAPVIGAGLAAGFTTIGVTGTSSFLAGAGGAAIITSSAAASGSFIGVRAANRRTGAVKTFEYRPLHNNKRVNLIVTVSGWLTGKVDDVRLPFSTVDPIMGDIYSVLWEPEMLRSMGDTINILATEVSSHRTLSELDTNRVGPHPRLAADPGQHHPGQSDGGAAAPNCLDQAVIPD